MVGSVSNCVYIHLPSLWVIRHWSFYAVWHLATMERFCKAQTVAERILCDPDQLPPLCALCLMKPLPEFGMIQLGPFVSAGCSEKSEGEAWCSKGVPVDCFVRTVPENGWCKACSSWLTVAHVAASCTVCWNKHVDLRDIRRCSLCMEWTFICESWSVCAMSS